MQYAGQEVYPQQVDLPDDGVKRDASEVNVPFEAVLDRTAWLASHRVHGIYRYAIQPTPPTIEAFPDSSWKASGVAKVTVPNVRAGDRLLVDLHTYGFYAQNSLTAGFFAELQLKVTDDIDGTPAPNPQTGQLAVFASADGGDNISLNADVEVAKAGTTEVSFEARTDALDPDFGKELVLTHALTIRVVHVRV